MVLNPCSLGPDVCGSPMFKCSLLLLPPVAKKRRKTWPYLVFNIQRAFVLMEKFQGIHVAMPRGPVNGIGSALCKNQRGVTFSRGLMDLNTCHSDTLYFPSYVMAHSKAAPSMRNHTPISFSFLYRDPGFVRH